MYINGAAGGNRTLVIITEKKFACFSNFSSELHCTDLKETLEK